MAHPIPTEILFNHEATLPIKPEATWALLRDFGTWDKWCPLYSNMRITNGHAGKVGAIRKYTIIVNNTTYEEKLTQLDDAHTTLGFDLLSSTPAVPGLVGISHQIVLKSVHDGEGTFIQRVTTNKVVGLAPEFIEVIKGKQLKSYDAENAILQARVSAQKMIMDGMGFFNDNVLKLAQAIMIGQSPVWEYDEYPDWMGYLPKMVKGLPISEVLPAHKLGDMLTRFIELVYQQAGAYIKAQLGPQQAQTTGNIYELETLGLVLSGHAEPRGLKELTAYLIQNWESDVEFCQQTLQGLNPMHIKLVETLDEVPDVLQTLTSTDHSGTKTVKQLIGEKRLFILDYRELANFSLCNFTPKTYFTAPVLLAYREIVDDHHSRLNVLGIQLHPSRNEIFTPQMKQHNRYKLARMFVACADTQFHEFRYHLGIAHMGMEPFAVSTHNRLPKRDDFTHPLRLMLAPHLEGTIGIAWFARQTLIAEKEAFTDKTFALGTKQGLLLASDGWRKYDFFKSSFPEQLKARGFDEARTDGLTDYHYRDDGFKLWNLIGEYTTSSVNTFYKDDAAVADDGDLQMWADETASKEGGNIPGFPSSITTKKDLAHILQIIIWNGSAQHSVINYPQAPYQTLVPSRPNAMYQPMPDLPADGSDVSDDYLKSALASEFPMLFQLLFTWLLSLPADSNLLNLKAFGTKYPELDTAFHSKMVALTEELNKRNEALTKAGKAPYLYLLPENVACSVNI